ncbi:MAG: efflux RND transporter periplasmic adaptor subunit [candidate division KSB1 bacterium]|nr:efflux RND transporter periplasmic adaptor subunit [candidate division KSB1 bacterium]
MTIKTYIQNHKWTIIALAAGLFSGWLFFHSPAPQPQSGEHADHAHAGQEETIWTCSMHPQIRQDESGQCPICGMDLIPLSSAESDGVDPDAITMTKSAAKLADIQTMRASRGTPKKSVFLQGKVTADERNIAELTARFGGRIEKLFVNFTGETVKKGEKLVTIYSPGLISAQQELIEARALKNSRPSLYQAARAKLKLWELSDEQIADIEQQGEPKLYFDVLSPISGTVMKRHVSLGDYIKEGSALFQVIDLSRVWVRFDAYESDLPWISVGDPVKFSIQSRPGKTYSARVAFVDPMINPRTRTAAVRLNLSNEQRDLKPEMFVRGVLHSRIAEATDKLLIPKTAILWTGKRAVVYVKMSADSPTFRYREITLGPQAGDFYVVADGLQPGEEIAVNGVFKIDAAAQLEGKPSMMNPGGGEISAGHDHGGMDMPSGDGPKTETPAPAEAVPGAFKEQLTRVYRAYLQMKDAFVDSDPEQVSQSAGQVSDALKQVDMGLLQGETHMTWMDQLEQLNTSVKAIAETSDLKAKRLEFSDFNQTFYSTVKTFGLADVTAYYQYCPMANKDTGAYWLSSSKEIRNPYFGDAMLKCGETRETIK